MATILATQLQAFQTAQTDLLLHKKRTPSILFSADKAATLSRERYHEIGYEGFKELMEVDIKFREFEYKLFDEKSKTEQRAVQTSEQNKKLDDVLEKFLIMVSPHLNLSAAKKSLEWLIQRFLIHEMNINSFVFCILPYHSTAVFIRVLSVINLKRNVKAWDWLIPYQQNGTPVPPKTVFERWANNQWFRNFITSSFQTASKVLNRNELNKTYLFFMITQVGGVDAAGVIGDDHVNVIMRTLGTFLASKIKERICGAYLLVMRLSMKLQMSKTFMDELLKVIAKTVLDPVAPVKECAACLLTICDHQEVVHFSAEVVKDLIENDDFLDFVCELAPTKTVYSFMVPLVQAWVRLVVDESNTGEECKSRLEEVVVCLANTRFSVAEAEIVLTSFIDTLKEFEDKFRSMSSAPDFAIICQTLDRSHPDCLPEHAHLFMGTDVEMADLTKDFGVEMTDLSPVEDEAAKFEEQCDVWQKELKQLDYDLICTTDFADEYSEDLNSAMAILWKVTLLEHRHQIPFKRYQELLQVVFKDQLVSETRQLKFLSLMWSRSGFDDQEEEMFNLHWSLSVAHIIMEKKTTTKQLQWLMAKHELFVFSVLLPLCHGSSEVRASAMELLAIIVEVPNPKAKSSTGINSLLKALLQCKEEIIADTRYLPEAISSLFSQSPKDGARVMKVLLDTLTDIAVPLRLKSAMLYCLTDVQDLDILPKLVPLADAVLDLIVESKQRLDTPTSLRLYYVLSRLTSSDTSSLECSSVYALFVRCLKLDQPLVCVHDKDLSPRDLVTKSRFLSKLVDSEVVNFTDVLDTLITQVMDTSEYSSLTKLRKELRKIPLNASVILKMFQQLSIFEVKRTSVKEARAKSLKLLNNTKESSKKTFEWRKFEMIVELVEILDELQDPWILIGPLFDCLQASQRLDASFNDMLQQKVLDTLHHLLQTCSQALEHEELTKCVKLNVPCLVQAIRNSTNPGTHRRSLMILSLSAGYFPKEVLANIIPIFTFMGSSLMRRDDSYSIEVMHEAINSIVPALLQTKSTELEVMLPKLAQVVQAFVDALPDIPEHRKLPLFTQLADLLVQHKQLWLLMALIADSLAFIGMGPTSKRDGRFQESISFLLLLYSQFPAFDQFEAIAEALEFVIHLPESQEDYLKTKVEERNVHYLAIQVTSHTPKQLRQLQYFCVGLIVQLLTSKRLANELSKILRSESEDSQRMTALLEKVVAKAILHMQVVKSNIEKSNDGRFWSFLYKKMKDLLSHCIALVPPQVLLRLVSEFVNQTGSELRICSMEILVAKLQPSCAYFRKEHMANGGPLLLTLCKLGCDGKESAELRQLSLLAAHSMVRHFGKSLAKVHVIGVLETCLPIMQSSDVDPLIRSQCLLAATEAVCVLKTAAIGYLNPVMTYMLSLLKVPTASCTKQQEPLLLVALSALQKVVKAQPDFISAQVSELVCLLCRWSVQFEATGQKDLKTAISSALKQVMTINPRILFAKLNQIHQPLMDQDWLGYPVIMRQVEKLLSKMDKTVIYKNKNNLVAFFKTSLNVRVVKGFSEAVDKVEDSIFVALLKFLVKFNQEESKQIFNMLLDHAVDRKQFPSEDCRMVTFFRFANQCARAMNKIFVSIGLADGTLELASELLSQNHIDDHSKHHFGTGVDSSMKTCQLLECVLDTTTTIFRNTNDLVTSPHKYEYFLLPLTRQLENVIGGDDVYRERMTNHLVPCIVRLAVLSRDDGIWEKLNQQIFSYTAHDDKPLVILSALDAFEGIIDALGEDFITPLISEIMTSITQCLETLDPQLQSKTRKIFKKIQSLVGGSLQAYIEG